MKKILLCPLLLVSVTLFSCESIRHFDKLNLIRATHREKVADDREIWTTVFKSLDTDLFATEATSYKYNGKIFVDEKQENPDTFIIEKLKEKIEQFEQENLDLFSWRQPIYIKMINHIHAYHKHWIGDNTQIQSTVQKNLDSGTFQSKAVELKAGMIDGELQWIEHTTTTEAPYITAKLVHAIEQFEQKHPELCKQFIEEEQQ